MTNEREKAVPTVQIENERIIVTEWSFAPGAETTWHTHEYDYVVVPQTTGKLLIEAETGDKISELTVGQSYSRQKGMKHNVVNSNDYQFTFIEIELK
ncbi:MAG: cupin domain-containing protein [Sedimenticola sp.]